MTTTTAPALILLVLGVAILRYAGFFWIKIRAKWAAARSLLAARRRRNRKLAEAIKYLAVDDVSQAAEIVRTCQTAENVMNGPVVNAGSNSLRPQD